MSASQTTAVVKRPVSTLLAHTDVCAQNISWYFLKINIPAHVCMSPFLKPFPDKPWFLRVCSRSLLKTL